MPRIRRFAIAISACVLLSCNRGPSKTIGVVPKGANHMFWQTVHAGAVKAGREFGYEIDWQAPTMEVDSSRQIAIVDAMINRRVAGLALAPIDKQALSGVVDRASKSGIPVAIFDSAIDTTTIVSYVATDNEHGGELAADRLASLLRSKPGKHKIAIVGFMAGSAATMQREDGFEKELKKYPDILNAGLERGNGDRAKAMSITENLLTSHPDLEGIFADNESSSMGALQAIKAHNRRDIRIVAFDSSPELTKALEDGWLDSLIIQEPFKMGYESVKAIARKLKGETPDARLDSGVHVVTRKDLDLPEIKALLFPNLDEYLKH